MLHVILLLILTTYGAFAEWKCPDDYRMMDDGRCIRPVLLKMNLPLGQAMSLGMEECKKDSATLPIIRNDQENAMFNDIFASFVNKADNPGFILGAVCNSVIMKLEWMDGTSIDYTYKHADLDFDCVLYDFAVYSTPMIDLWGWGDIHSTSYQWSALCVAEPIMPWDDECENYDHIANPTDTNEPCFKIFPDAMSWSDAEATCASDFASLAKINSDAENKFFWRTAISMNTKNNLHIGAYQGSDNGWKWIDGNANISGYSNFHTDFPVAGAGSCVSMLVESPSAQWINEDCETQKLAFICRRKVLHESSECPTTQPTEGEDIFPPGFPHPTIPCEYMLFVPANHLVRLEILAFEVQTDVAFLELYEGMAGNNLIASLTGTHLDQTVYTTATSNVMRVNWRPDPSNPPEHDRGFRIRYTAISK